jgi:hypothetical protein
MRKNRTFLLLLLLSAALFFKMGCVDIPKDLVAPKWDVTLNAPITNKTYTLWDAIKKDTSKLHTYSSGSNAGLLYYSDIKRIDRITVGDNLNVSSFSASSSASIGSIKISDPLPVTLAIEPAEINSSVVYDVYRLFPAVGTTNITKSFSQSAQFSSVTLESGSLSLGITNNFPSPVHIYISKLVIRNQSDNSVIIEDYTYYDLDSKTTRTLLYNLAGKTVNQVLNIEATIASNGSGTTTVNLNENTNITFTAQVQNYTFSQVTAILSQNTFNISDSYQFDDSTYVQTAVIDRGSLKITANNNLDIALTATLTVQSLKDASGNIFTQVISLGRKEKNKVISIPSLSGYTLSDPSNSLVNVIKYSISVVSAATSDFRTIYKTDNVSAKMDISDLYFRTFTGKIKPTNLTVNETSIDLNLGDVSDKLLVGQIDMENPSIQLKLQKSTNMQVNFSGQLIGRSTTQTSQLSIPTTTIGSGETVITLNTTDVRNFIKSFNGKLPSTVSVKGHGVVNPNYSTATVAAADSVYGTANIEFPMKISITGGSFRDSSNVDLSDSDRKEMNKVSGGSLVMEISNGIAFDASVSARLYDASNNFLMNLPPNRTPNDTLTHVQAAVVNSSGKVTSATATKITFSLNKSEVELLTQSKYIISKISFYTSGNNSVPVEFRTSDAIQIKVYGTLNYTVEESK